jgi:hypothetical protein
MSDSLPGLSDGQAPETKYLRYDIVSQKDLAIAREKLAAFHIELKQISTRKGQSAKITTH